MKSYFYGALFLSFAGGLSLFVTWQALEGIHQNTYLVLFVHAMTMLTAYLTGLADGKQSGTQEQNQES